MNGMISACGVQFSPPPPATVGDRRQRNNAPWAEMAPVMGSMPLVLMSMRNLPSALEPK